MNFTSTENETFAFDVIENSTDFFLNKLNDDLYGSTAAKIGFGFMLGIIHVIGPILMLGIVLFEMNGGDPQKTNLINMLQSLALINLIIFTCLLGGCKIWRQAVGLIQFDTMKILESVGYVILSNIILLMDQMTILKYFHIVVWKRVKGLNDEFLAYFCRFTTLLWSLTITLIDHLPFAMQKRTMHLFQFKMMTGNSPYSFDQIQ